ncbi:ABC transporter permease [Actinomycetospora chiangmaiensis]|uniref:ABC transporter permease n=1 Tax=Actinomycetospora chiangmaiensis TaxID=402650 RepID=UPI0004782D8C|nr:ABC transporter permease subunit [Actinomycetospora chiangmaiensis]
MKQREVPAWVGVVPFAAYTVVFLGVPVVAVVLGSFVDPATGAFTLDNFGIATSGVYLRGFGSSIGLSLVTALVPGVLGLVLALAVRASPSLRLKRAVATASGVFANFGGVPLAFLFVATLGSTGLVVELVKAVGVDLYGAGFSLYSFWGVAIVYGYFQIPLMVLVITPALEGLRPNWREAADNLGATPVQYWRHVGLPVLAPAVLGCMLLLFGSAFSAYATTSALTSGSLALTPIQIGSFLNGNVLSGQENVGRALGVGMIVVVGVLMALYALLQRRVSRWLQ